MNNIAVLITCFNRCDVTRKCFTRLFALRSDIDVYCVDDNSTDGTDEMIQKEFPQVNLIKGAGNLFWNRGMRLAWETALESSNDYSYFFWLNDDLELYPNAFDELLECCQINDDNVIVSGLVQESTSGVAIYGGHYNGKIIEANGDMNPIINMNGNFVAIPRAVVTKIGILDSVYHHDIGDVDYGLTAIEAGISVVSSRCYIGKTDGKLKSPHKRNRRSGVNIRQRFRILYSPLGSNPNITFHFISKHQGLVYAIGYYAYVHFINMLPDKIYNIISR
ncbi:glycosyltransferase family 2 protein [uncultured Duncaniella sp.]|uniref:glycosyltransferase family 2 protein n=1 Tax=uncultured Duncaniella sp. TaxID=2768039 RepID=UPI0025B58037|nr:glycosyltransferase family 2 protein [uncultured Duncaniella sp.]